MIPDQLVTHLSVNRYGNFTLPEAVRPGRDVLFRPLEGYRVDLYRDRTRKIRLPMLTAVVSAERLFDTFLDLLKPLGKVVHVVLESSHGSPTDEHADLRRDHIDMPVLASHFCDFENLLTHDGCAGVAVMATGRPIEMQFDEHKLFRIYANDLKPFRRILRRSGLTRQAELSLISEGEHFHHTTEGYADDFRQLATRLGVGDFDRVFSDGSW